VFLGLASSPPERFGDWGFWVKVFCEKWARAGWRRERPARFGAGAQRQRWRLRWGLIE
jgi:hypothetical protein